MENGKTNLTADLYENATILLTQERQKAQACAAAILEIAGSLRASKADRRLHRLTALVKDWQQQSIAMTGLIQDEIVNRSQRETEFLARQLAGIRLGTVLTSLLDTKHVTLGHYSDTLLYNLMEQTRAEKGFVLFWFSESTEADILAARNFQTKILSAEEYRYSRTLLQAVLGGQPLRVEDAAADSHFGAAHSVREYKIRSVLAVPLQDSDRTAGAIFLENNSRPAAFDESDLALLQDAARYFMLYLEHIRLLPAVLPPETHVFFDPTQASSEIIGQDPAILSLLSQVKQIADSPATVLIGGESGTGKELVARALHHHSRRRDKPLVIINCATIPENLLEAELFGHEKGAFTGASEQYLGQIEQADGGTVFFDEIGEIPLSLQSKLLRFLQSGEFRRVMGKGTLRADVRVVAATSQNLAKMVEEGRFQGQLFFRLNVIPLRLPKLAERKGDIPLLVEHFRGKFAAMYKRSVQIDPDVIEVLKEYPFPGNVRELENIVHRVVALSTSGQILLADLPREILQVTSGRIPLGLPPEALLLQTPPRDMAELRRRRSVIRKIFDKQQRQLLQRAIDACGGNITEAAGLLGINRATAYKILNSQTPSRSSRD